MCQFEEECMNDSDCLNGGKCINIDSTTYPSKQCFCADGFFGANCGKTSSFKQSDLSEDSESYTSQNFATDKMYSIRYKVIEDEVRIVMKVKLFVAKMFVSMIIFSFKKIRQKRLLSLLWVGNHYLLIQAVKLSPTCPKRGEQVHYEAESEAEAEAESEPESEAESEPESEAESEPESESEAEAESESESEAEAEHSEKYHGHGEAESEPEAESESEPEAESESEPEGESESEPEGEHEPESESESEPEAEAIIQTTTKNLNPSLNLNQSHESESESEPESESESEPESESESEPEAEAEPEHKKYKTKYYKKHKYQPRGRAHAMDCTDIVIGTAKGRFSRVYDAYTRDRSTPKPDSFYGGEDDITGACAFEDDEGFTTVRLPKKAEEHRAH